MDFLPSIPLPTAVSNISLLNKPIDHELPLLQRPPKPPFPHSICIHIGENAPPHIPAINNERSTNFRSHFHSILPCTFIAIKKRGSKNKRKKSHKMQNVLGSTKKVYKHFESSTWSFFSAARRVRTNLQLCPKRKQN